MDTTDPDIVFDERGICNHCIAFSKMQHKIYLLSKEEKDRELQVLCDKIKESGKNKEYDCIIGLSGGVDSSYVAYIAKQNGLRPLAIHVDNGWNSELSVKNIENIVKTLSIDLFTYVIDWEEFRDLQTAFIKSGVIDIEMLTDHAIGAVMYKIAREKGISVFLSGTNTATESIMPASWFYANKLDSKNIIGILREHDKERNLKSFPLLSFFEYIMFRYFRVLKDVHILDYVNYDKLEAKKILQEKLGWVDYGGKHYESIFTRFYQAYILPNKFNVDKRRAHLSSLILSKQVSREEALKIMKENLYEPVKLREDKEYVIKKLNMNKEDFDKYIALPPGSHYDYPSFDILARKLSRVKRIIKRLLRK
jgi:N-acetyl sugar amidotransferase